MEAGHIQRGGSLTDNITLVSNNVIRDREMPAIDFKLLCWFMSHDKSFVIKKLSLHKHFKEGRDAVAAAFKRLVDAKFIIAIEIFNAGKFDGYNYLVYPEPLTENQYMVILDEIAHNDNGKVLLNENKPLTENPLTENQYPFKKTNSKSNGKSIDLPSVKNVIDNNIKTIGKCPMSVLGKAVTLDEINTLVDIVREFNLNRSMYMRLRKFRPEGYEGTLSFDAKACRQSIELMRAGYSVEEYNDATMQAFEDQFHEDNKYKYITPEYISRMGMFQKYLELSQTEMNVA